MKVILVFLVSILVVVILGGAIAGAMNTTSDKWCLYDPWYLLFKNKSIYMVLIPGSLILLPLVDKMYSIGWFVSYKRTIKTSFYTLQAVAFVSFIYFSGIYGNFGSGACSNPNVNVDYYKYPGQEMYFKETHNKSVKQTD